MKAISFIFLPFIALLLSGCKKQKSATVEKKEEITVNKFLVQPRPVDRSISLRYDSIGGFRSGYAPVFKNGKTGLINVFGHEITPCLYDFIGPFVNDMAMVHLDWKLGYVNKMGDVIIKPKYDLPENYIYDQKFNPDFFELSDGLIGVILDDECGFINPNGKEIIPCKYDYALPFKEGLAFTKKDGYWYIINKIGKEMKLEKKYSLVSSFNDGLAMVALNCPGEWGNKDNPTFGYIDRTGKEVVPCIYEFACYDLLPYKEDDGDYFSEGLLMVKRNGKFGFVNKKGKIVVPLKYENAKSFSEGLAPVLLNEKWGFINKNGKVVIPFMYDGLVDGFAGGLATVCVNRLDKSFDDCGLIDKNGRVVVPFKYDYQKIPYPDDEDDEE